MGSIISSAPRTRRAVPPGTLLRHLRESVVARLLWAADILDRQSALCVVLIASLFLLLGVRESAIKLLTSDEIYTFQIAQQPTMRSMLGLAREIDLHPPLHYLAERYSLQLGRSLGLPQLLAARLFSILAGLLASLSLFAFVRRRSGNLTGLVAVAALWSTPVLTYAWNNRPYMLWLGLFCATLAMRDQAIALRRSPWALLGVFLLVTAMVGTHLLGVACILPLVAAEGVRFRRTGWLDWPLVLCEVLPSLLGASLYYQIHHVSQNAFPTGQTASLGLALDAFGQMLHDLLPMFSVCALAVIALLDPAMARGKNPPEKALSPDDIALLAAIGLLPITFVAGGMLLHLQFWPRYSSVAVPAIAVLVAMTVRRLPAGRLVAVVLLLATTGYVADWAIEDAGPVTDMALPSAGRPLLSLARLDPNLPLVAASPMTFTEMAEREPAATVHRLYYLTDRDAAYRYAHYTLFENEDKIARLLKLPAQTAPLQPFLAAHNRFYVLGDYKRPEIWLLRALADRGLHLEYLGECESTYQSNDLYLVTRTP